LEAEVTRRTELAAKAASRSVEGFEDLTAAIPGSLVEHAATIFESGDTDGSGAIDRSELPALLRSLGLNLSPESMEEFVTSSTVLADVNDDGLISK